MGTAQKSHKKKKKNKKSGKQTSANTGDDLNKTDDGKQDNTPSAHESIETMKNILLETFLSDFCEEMGLGAMANMDFGSLPEMDLDENEEDLEGNDITFDEDPLELLMKITDTGSSTTNTYVKESITKSNDNVNADDTTEPNKKKKSRSRRRKKNKKSAGNSETSASNEAHSVSEDNKQTADKRTHETGNVVNENNSESKMTLKSNGEVRNEENGIKETVVPPEGEQIVSAFDEMSVTEPKNIPHETDTTEHSEETFSGKLLYPGEVDDDDTTTSGAKETRLEFKATYSDTTEDNSPSTTQVCMMKSYL